MPDYLQTLDVVNTPSARFVGVSVFNVTPLFIHLTTQDLDSIDEVLDFLLYMKQASQSVKRHPNGADSFFFYYYFFFVRCAGCAFVVVVVVLCCCCYATYALIALTRDIRLPGFPFETSFKNIAERVTKSMILSGFTCNEHVLAEIIDSSYLENLQTRYPQYPQVIAAI